MGLRSSAIRLCGAGGSLPTKQAPDHTTCGDRLPIIGSTSAIPWTHAYTPSGGHVRGGQACSCGPIWSGLLGRPVVDGVGGALLSGERAMLGLAFVPHRTEKVRPNRMHLHLTSLCQADLDQTVETALRLGAHHLDVGQLADEGHVVLADPGGNEFCVIERGNSFLAGCGFVGELACDGSREVGLFWSAALAWPLVWDQGQETAIQSQAGGTKIAWGGPSVQPRTTADRQRFDLVVDGTDPEVEVERLLCLGARLLQRDEPRVTVFADPDGFEFRLHASPG